MYKCENCGSMALLQLTWTSVNPDMETDCVIDEEPMWCNSCDSHIDGIELPVVKYTYEVDMFELQNDQLVKAEKLTFEIGASANGFYYKFPESFGWKEISDDYHALEFRKWLDKRKTMYHIVSIPCYPKLDLSQSRQAAEEFFKGKPKIDSRVIEIGEILQYDRVVDTVRVRRDSGVDSILIEQD